MPNFSTHTGEGRAIIDCTFNVDDEGDVVDLEITHNGNDVFGLLTEDQVLDIEGQCYDSYCEEARENDPRIDEIADVVFA